MQILNAIREHYLMKCEADHGSQLLGDRFFWTGTDQKDLSYNPEHHNRTKHVERRHFFIRDMVEKFELRVPLVSTVNNYADFFTKPLKSKAFFGLRNKIMNIA